METVTTINGNGCPVTKPLPVLCILTETDINDVALAHVFENTGLRFVRGCGGYGGYEAQPTEAKQIAALFLTYNFKTQYHDNALFSNTLLLKFDHHTGFKVDSICFDCCRHNHIPVNGLEQGDRLAC